MTTATTTADTSRRRTTRMAAGSLARFQYRDNDDSDSDNGVKKEERDGDDSDDDHRPSDDDDSSLSELSLNSDIEDAVSAPRKKTARGAAAARTKSKTLTTTTAGKRKRAATVTTTVTTELPTHKKRNGVTASIKREIKDEEEDGPDLASIQKAATPRKTRKPARTITTKVTDGKGGEREETRVEPPADWELFYNLVKEMRQPGGPAANAAVDTMGCERLAMASASPRDRRFHTLVALMLSSQTKDTVNAAAMARLQSELPPHAPGAPGGLNLENMLAVDPALLNQLIWQVGFHNNKTKYLKQAAVILRDQWGGDIPPTAEGLMALPGVGPKMAYLCLAAENGWNRVEGIGVDVHVHRITNLWHWQKPGSAAAKTPEGTRLALQSWLPRDKWKEINWLLVGFGQAVCLPQGARCGDCTLGLRGLCRAANRKKVAEGRKKRRELGLDVLEGEKDSVIKDEATDESD